VAHGGVPGRDVPCLELLEAPFIMETARIGILIAIAGILTVVGLTAGLRGAKTKPLVVFPLAVVLLLAAVAVFGSDADLLRAIADFAGSLP
jgi:hypothetical protein